MRLMTFAWLAFTSAFWIAGILGTFLVSLPSATVWAFLVVGFVCGVAATVCAIIQRGAGE